MIKEIMENAVKSIPDGLCEYAFIDPHDIDFTAEVRAACEKNYCGMYGKCWSCPPGVGDYELLREHFYGYKNAFVYTTCHPLEDSFDIEGMEKGRILHEKADAYFEKALAGEKFELSGAGGCTVCEKCSYPDAPCRFPDKMKRSLEACGMDIYSLAKKTGIKYSNGENTVTYFSIIFW